MKRVRIGWAIFCAVCDIALSIKVCMVWASNENPWWSLLLAAIFYAVGCFSVWNFFDDIFYAEQKREEGNIYYKEENRHD